MRSKQPLRSASRYCATMRAKISREIISCAILSRDDLANAHRVSENRLSSFCGFASTPAASLLITRKGYPQKMGRKKRASIITYRQSVAR
jgi:hypothetical protein